MGPIYRNYNSPTLALNILDPAVQSRFVFANAGDEVVAGEAARKLQFAEISRPTLISANDDRDVPSSGWLWVRPSDGAVLKPHLRLARESTAQIAGMDSSILVDYQRNAKLAMWVPSRMEEAHLVLGSTYDRIDCVATYSNFRRFETSGCVVSPK